MRKDQQTSIDDAEPSLSNVRRSISLSPSSPHPTHRHHSQPLRGEGEIGAGAIGTVTYPRLVPHDEECARQLNKRTLTNLDNQRPTWLDLAHKKLDEAVFAAYGWDPAISDEDLLAALLERRPQRAALRVSP